MRSGVGGDEVFVGIYWVRNNSSVPIQMRSPGIVAEFVRKKKSLHIQITGKGNPIATISSSKLTDLADECQPNHTVG